MTTGAAAITLVSSHKLNMRFFMQQLNKYSQDLSTMAPLIQQNRKQLREVEPEFKREFFLLQSLPFLFQQIVFH